MVRITATAPLFPTEVPARVAAAVTAWLPGAQATVTPPADNGAPGQVTASGVDPGPLRTAIWQQRIIDAVRGRMLHGADADGITLAVHKQAAMQGQLALPVAASALGDVLVRIDLDDGDEALAGAPVLPEADETSLDGDDAGELQATARSSHRGRRPPEMPTNAGEALAWWFCPATRDGAIIGEPEL